MDELLKYQKQITELQTTLGLLRWELMIVAPEASSDNLIGIISDLESKMFALQTSKEYGKKLKKVINSTKFQQLSESECRYIKNLYEKFVENQKIPNDFYVKYTELLNKTNLAWIKAKEVSDFNIYKPYLKDVIDMTKKYYSYINIENKKLYDVMLNRYEKGMTCEKIDELFAPLKEFLIPFINKVSTDKKKEYKKKMSRENMLECAKYLLQYIGFDLNRGAIDFYEHGFTEKLSPDDVRITFSYSDDPINFITTVIHEGGHGIFEQNINRELTKYEHTSIDNGFALHESISRFYENVLGRNKNFWIPIYDDVKRILNLDIDIDEFVSLLNQVSKSKIRVNADEVTYPLHIILRYEIEKEIFNNNIDVEVIPKLWNEKTKEYLGIDSLSDNEGLMQDIHWSQGAFGYFPSYLLGTIYDGIILNSVDKNIAKIDDLLKCGKVIEITNYLIKNIFINGGAFTAEEVFNKMSYNISTQPIIDYFKKKYN